METKQKNRIFRSEVEIKKISDDWEKKLYEDSQAVLVIDVWLFNVLVYDLLSAFLTSLLVCLKCQIFIE